MSACMFGDESVLMISGRDGKPLVRIDSDGTVWYGVGYTPDAAAKIFFEAIASQPWMLCRKCREKIAG